MFDMEALRNELKAAIIETLDERETLQARLHGGRIAFSEAEAAAMLGVKPHQIRDWRLDGKLRAHKPGKAWLYDREELIEDFRKL